MIDKIEYAIQKSDYITGTAAVTSPFWLRYLENYGTAYAIIGGTILLTIRIAIAIREWRRGRVMDE